MKFLNCNAVTASPKVTKTNCGVLLQQARRIIYFDLPYATALGDATTILAAGTLSALVAATDATKAILPQHQLFAPRLNSTEPVTYGSNDNTTPGGRTYILNESIPTFEAMYTGLLPGQYGEYETIYANSNASFDLDTVGVGFLLGDDQLMINTSFKPIPVRSMFIGSPSGMELNGLTQFPIRFELKKGWYRTATIYTLSYNHEILG